MRRTCAIRGVPVKSWVFKLGTFHCRCAWKRAQGRGHTTIVGADIIRPNKGRMQYAPTLRRVFYAIVLAGAMLLGAFPRAPTIIGFANAGSAYAGPAANVDFVHRYITKKWGITVPIKTSNIYQAVNVKYTLCAVDRANEILNGAPSATTYCNHQLATNQIIDDLMVRDAVNRLVKLVCPAGTYNAGGAATSCTTCSGTNGFCPAGSIAVTPCSALSGVNPAGGTFTSVSPFSASTNCRYTAPAKTIAGCASVTPQQVAYTGSAWPASTYSVTASGGYIIANNGTASATCSQCGAGTYSAGGSATGCSQCPKDNYCLAGSSAPTPCSTVGAGFITDAPGATSASQCHSSVLIADGYYCLASLNNAAVSYSGGTTPLQCVNASHSFEQPPTWLDGYIITGRCSANGWPSGCTNTQNIWSSQCVGSPTYSAAGIYCWCQLMRASDGVRGQGWVFLDNRSTAQNCAGICASVCYTYAYMDYYQIGSGGAVTNFINLLYSTF